ncbi:hypothetical protein ACTFIY_004208 [Dictyostelium cf. discoideum]
MFRYGLRVLSKAVDAKSAEAITAVPKGGYPAYLKPFLEGSEVLPPSPERSQFEKESDYINAIIAHPVIQRSPNALKIYNEFQESKRAMATYEPIPGETSEPVVINWDFYKKILPEDTVEFFRALEKKTHETIASWEVEDKKFIDFLLKKIKSDEEASKETQKSLYLTIQAIEADKKQMDDFLTNLRTTTFEDLHGKYPEIDEEIYQEISNDEWMPKDLVGEETIYNKAKEAHHH